MGTAAGARFYTRGIAAFIVWCTGAASANTIESPSPHAVIRVELCVLSASVVDEDTFGWGDSDPFFRIVRHPAPLIAETRTTRAASSLPHTATPPRRTWAPGSAPR